MSGGSRLRLTMGQAAALVGGVIAASLADGDLSLLVYCTCFALVTLVILARR